MRRFLTLAAFGILAVLAIAFIFAPEYEVSFSEEDIRRKVAAEIPHSIKSAGVSILVRSASVDLRADNRIAIAADVDATGFTLVGTGRASINSSVRYERGRFYFGDLTHDDLAFSFSESSNETIKDVTQTLRGLLEREGAEARAAGDTNKAENVDKIQDYARQQLKVDSNAALDFFLQSIPIYDMNGQGATMWLAALSIQSVEISEDQVTAVLSFQLLVIRLIAATLTVLLCIAIYAPSITWGAIRWLFLKWTGRKDI